MIQVFTHLITDLSLEQLRNALPKTGPGPFATVTVDVDQCQAIIEPNLVQVNVGGPMIWGFLGVPLGYQPHVDFVAFRPGHGKITRSFRPPFEELTVGPLIVAGARATGPKGLYWYKISLVPDRQTGDDVIRLDCHLDSYYKPEDVDSEYASPEYVSPDGAGVEVSGPPREVG